MPMSVQGGEAESGMLAEELCNDEGKFNVVVVYDG